MIQKQQGSLDRRDACPVPLRSFGKTVKSKHCCVKSQPGLGTTLMLVKHDAPRGPGSSPGRERGKASPCRFPGLVVIARAKHPIPSRTRPLSAVAPMVLRLKTWESRSPPNLKSDNPSQIRCQNRQNQPVLLFPNQNTGNNRRGVEQPGSSSGS